MKNRLARAALITTASIAIATAAAIAADVQRSIQKASIGTAYAATLLLALTLSLGPLSTLRGRRYPTSTVTRRDLGIGAAILALIHTALGLQVHVGGNIRKYFIPQDMTVFSHASQTAFLAANHTGLISLLLLVVVLGVSNDLSLKRMGAKRWKRLQRLAYIAALVAAFHGTLYLLLEHRVPSLAALFVAITTTTAALQLAGRSARRAAALPAADEVLR
ncbi:MAG: ferric reductase-like transmembrane domain-containing protein [Gemmatimonas sp.]